MHKFRNIFLLIIILVLSACGGVEENAITEKDETDKIKPVISLNGDASTTIAVGDTYADAGATASDTRDGTLTTKIIKTGSVDSAQMGTYTLKYNVSDAAGNKANEVTRTIIVKSFVINAAPTIIGTPKTRINVYNTYQFVPVANDINNDTLTYRIENKPSWAEFNSTTGELKGLLSSTDVGNSPNIIISVSDATETVSLTPFSIDVIPAVNLAIAYGKATQGDIWDSRVASKAIDGDVKTYNHVNGVVPDNWWQLELPKESKIHKIVIRNSIYLPESLQNAKMYINNETHTIGSTDFGTADKTLSNEMVQVFTYNPPVESNYVLMQGNLIPGASYSLHMGEVEVYGELPPKPYFEPVESVYFVAEASTNGSIVATVKASDLQNDVLTYSIDENMPFSIDNDGHITVNGLLDHGTYIVNVMASDGTNSTTIAVTITVNRDGKAENIAHNFGIATQGSGKGWYYFRDAANAIDNNLSTFNMTANKGFLQVALPRGTQLSKVVIRNRRDHHTYRLSGAKVYLGTTDFNGTIVPGDEVGTLTRSTAPQTFTFDTLKNVDYILLKPNNYLLHVLEVEAYGVTPPAPDFKDRNAFTVTINKWQNKTQSIFDASAIDYQDDTIVYSLDGNLPFSISTDGKINVSNILTEGDYVFDIVITDGANTRRKSITITVVNTAIVNITPFRSNDNQPELSGFLPNIYNDGDNVTIEINGGIYTATVNNGKWKIEENTITPSLTIGLHDVKLFINNTEILYANYFEVYAERMQSIKKSLVLANIADVTVNVINSITTPLVKDEKVRGRSIRLYVENGITKLQNKSYRTIASLLGKYDDANGESVFVKLDFSENIQPYSDNNLSTFSHDTEIQIVTTASHFNGEFSFGGDDCTLPTMSSVRYCTPTSINDVIYSTHAVNNGGLSEHQVYSIALATYHHFFNSIDGLKMMRAWVEKSTYKNMNFTGDYQSIDSYIGNREKMAYLYWHFYNFTMPEHHVKLRSMRYKYRGQGMAVKTYAIPLDGSRSSSGWASLWEGTLDLDGTNDYEHILHEIGHTYSNNHGSGMTYGWPFAFNQVVGTLYVVKRYPVVHVPKYIFETKTISSTETKIIVHKTPSANENRITFELLSSTPLISNDLSISAGGDYNSVILTNNKEISTRLFIRVYGDDSREISSQLVVLPGQL
ncbi:MAG: DUF5011 domain-containing protein [Psychromonas sp.]|nr:DUF5011 domain-containing protein [Psychromonas sp.]